MFRLPRNFPKLTRKDPRQGATAVKNLTPIASVLQRCFWINNGAIALSTKDRGQIVGCASQGRVVDCRSIRVCVSQAPAVRHIRVNWVFVRNNSLRDIELLTIAKIGREPFCRFKIK